MPIRLVRRKLLTKLSRAMQPLQVRKHTSSNNKWRRRFNANIIDGHGLRWMLGRQCQFGHWERMFSLQSCLLSKPPTFLHALPLICERVYWDNNVSFHNRWSVLFAKLESEVVPRKDWRQPKQAFSICWFSYFWAKHFYRLRRFPQCCFHPVTQRPRGNLWGCLRKYKRT